MKRHLLRISGWLFITYAGIELLLCLASLLVPAYFSYVVHTPSLFFSSMQYQTLFDTYRFLVILLIAAKYLCLLAFGLCMIRFSKQKKLKSLSIWLIAFAIICGLLGQFILALWIIFVVLYYVYKQNKSAT